MSWKTMLAYVTGSVDEEVLLRNEYLAQENRILRAQLKGRVKLSDPDRITLAEIGKRLGRKALQEVANIVRPDAILAWHRMLVAIKFDGSKKRPYPGRPRVPREIEKLIVRMARDNRTWGYDRIVGALANLGHEVSDQTVGNLLKRSGLEPVPDRKKSTTWKEFIRSHLDVLAAVDFFTAEVWTMFGLTTYYVLFFMHLGGRRVHVAGVTPHPDESWMKQVARNLTMEGWGFLVGIPCRFLIHDRDSKFTEGFRRILESSGIRSVMLPPRSPNLNAFAERWALSVKQECRGRLVLFGESSLRHGPQEFVGHYHRERNRQGKRNALLEPDAGDRIGSRHGRIECRQRLGGLLRFYHREAA